ncbi:hypothetical protein J6590_013426 [Homalodisca vitripennis]|nr:hypothetical protein J6590_013426 [Homalodisca vitripennis]
MESVESGKLMKDSLSVQVLDSCRSQELSNQHLPSSSDLIHRPSETSGPGVELISSVPIARYSVELGAELPPRNSSRNIREL